MAADPVLALVREWLHTQGARLVKADPDVIAGVLADGVSRRYTCSPQRARLDSQAILVAPGTTERDGLLGEIERRGIGLALRVDAPPARPETLAREAFVVSPGAISADASGHVAGRFRIIGAGKGVREAAVERRWEIRTLEYTVRMSITSPFGRREELSRVALDAATGESRRPLDEAVLRQAHTASEASSAVHETDSAPWLLKAAERVLEPAARAAARLARAQALPEYQRRQDDIQTLYARLFQETPEQGAALLGARERELKRLAEARAIELQLQVVNWAAIISELARVRLRFAGGGDVTVDVDPCRGHVLDPCCPVCEEAWHIGARCADGHITCLNCQQVCAHCGERRCRQCARAAFTACPICGEPACSTCARRAAHSRHRIGKSHVQDAPDSATSARQAADASPSARPASAQEAEPTSREDLTVADLDTMTEATWQACLTWLLEHWGYSVEQTLDESTRRPTLLCRRAGLAPAAGSARFGDIVVVAAYRPDRPGSPLPPDVIRAALDQARKVPGARGVVVTTAHLDTPAEPLQSIAQRAAPVREEVAVLYRGALAEVLAAASGAYGQERQTAELKSDRHAAAAQAIQTVLMHATSSAASVLEHALSADTQILERRERSSTAAGGVAACDLEQAAMTVRQALAALETLVEEWEGCFAAVPTREGALSIVSEEGAFAGMRERADHLADALSTACSALIQPQEEANSLLGTWRTAVAEELQLRCLALDRRLATVDPSAWRSFSAAHDAQAARAAVEALAASGRAALRARRLLDEAESRRLQAATRQPGVRARSRN